ncbi:HAMP domain-containing sensor histidine kinase [Rubrobacter indicoceani]|uniref:HAMP domain-containing sensor histidine kinase n=1 Tax=Rubrobacter indicoceani TaxID=2051957 RepID=UPI000E5A9F6A|nr:ATP-binding protein [Rubrobacter indicoceani]
MKTLGKRTGFRRKRPGWLKWSSEAGSSSTLGLKARVFIALVGISSVASLVIGLVLYYFAQTRLTEAENNLLEQRSRTANAGAIAFVEVQRNPEDQTLPAPDTYAEELTQVVADPTGLGVVYIGPGGRPLAARDGLGDSAPPEQTLESLGVNPTVIEAVQSSSSGEGRLVRGEEGYVAVWPLAVGDGAPQGVMVYDSPQDELSQTLSYLRFGIVGAILTSVALGSLASYVMARQITRPLTETRDAAIRIASGDYNTSVPVTSRDELGEVARAVNYMSEEIEHYVGEIQEQKRRLEAVLEATPEALIATGRDERVTMSNPAAGMLGVSGDSQGQTLDDLGVNGDLISCVRRAASEGFAVREFEEKGKIYWAYAARMRPEAEKTSDGHQDDGPEIILAVRDITEHRSLERSKTAFVSDVSHELRTPLATIQSAVGLLERAGERLDPLEHRALELAEGELVRIRNMVEELLTLAQMDSWRYSLRLDSNSVERIIENARRSVAAKAERFGIELVSPERGDGGGLQIICDAEKLYQVFLNLIDNAVKYSESGARVEVVATEDPTSVTVSVRDTGPGIPPEDLPHLFERFYRVDKNRSRATGGSGLGLAISKQIVEMHGGEISVRSTPGEGSTFAVRLPKNPPTTTSSSQVVHEK